MYDQDFVDIVDINIIERRIALKAKLKTVIKKTPSDPNAAVKLPHQGAR